MKRIIFPLDVSDTKEAEHFIKLLNSEVEIFKIGLELFYKTGINWVENIKKKYDIKIFLDLKLHDIPNTVYRAVKNLLYLKPIFITVHLDEYKKFYQYVVEPSGFNDFLVVSFLTSLSEEDLKNLTNNRNITIKDFILKKAEFAYKSKCAGIVCSAQEAKYVKEKFGDSLKIITPGIRLKDGKLSKDDQERVVTPVDAIKNGSDYLVIGRPIRTAENPLEICKKINQDINKILQN
jgi:orotidine-5'-phosphate decarboxylase